MSVHHPARYRNLERIRTLDPERDAEEILHLTSRLEFPWDYTQGTGIAFLRDFGVPSIARLLDRTREFEDHGVKRYDDTILIGDEATLDGLDSPRGHAAVRRLNRIHGHRLGDLGPASMLDALDRLERTHHDPAKEPPHGASAPL